MHKYQIVSKRCQSGMEFSLFTLSSSLFQAFVFSSLCCSGLSQWLHWDNKSCFQSHVKPSVLAEPSALTANPAERLGGKSLDWGVTIPVGIRRLWFPFFLLRAQQMSACWHLEGMSSFSVSLLGSVLLSKHNVLKWSIWSSSCVLYMIYLSARLTPVVLCAQAGACLPCASEWLKPG